MIRQLFPTMAIVLVFVTTQPVGGLTTYSLAAAPAAQVGIGDSAGSDRTSTAEGDNFRQDKNDAASVASTATTPSKEWVIECADCPHLFPNMTNRSLRLDSAGRPHIAYGGDHLYYAWHDGEHWHQEIADDSPRVGEYASLALDGDGYPHISYHDRTNGDLKYAYLDASGWHTLTVDSQGVIGYTYYNSLALDEAGYPHISYCFIQNVNYTYDSDLKYAFQDAIGWHTQTVDWVGFVGINSSLAVDRDGYPHISYQHWDDVVNIPTWTQPAGTLRLWTVRAVLPDPWLWMGTGTPISSIP